MLKKNIEKKKRAQRPDQWTGYAPKYGPTKSQKLTRIYNKHKSSNIEY